MLREYTCDGVKEPPGGGQDVGKTKHLHLRGSYVIDVCHVSEFANAFLILCWAASALRRSYDITTVPGTAHCCDPAR